MKTFLLIALSCISFTVSAQKIINAVMVGDKGITEKVKEAKFLILVKTYADTAFERLEYNFTGPMKRRLTYKDPELKILNGNYASYYGSGYRMYEGKYKDNLKDGSWYFFNDTGKAILEYKYDLGILSAVLNMDSLDIENKKIKSDTTGEIEADYKGGMDKYTRLINHNFIIPERTQSLEKGGTVKVRFIVDTAGSVTNVQVVKSVEFAFDEEVMRVVTTATEWTPASQKGRKVKAYREQPLSLSFK
jgi:TonB family protein